VEGLGVGKIQLAQTAVKDAMGSMIYRVKNLNNKCELCYTNAQESTNDLQCYEQGYLPIKLPHTGS
jgi:hypothetical protein